MRLGELLAESPRESRILALENLTVEQLRRMDPEVAVRGLLRVLWRETGTGFVLGLVLCAFAFARVLLWGTGAPLAMTVVDATGLAIYMGIAKAILKV